MSYKKNIKADFEFANSSEDNVTFRKRINSKGKTSKQIRLIQSSLPTTKLHYFTEKEFNRLKEIEMEIIKEFELKYIPNNRIKNISFSAFLFKFLEI
jgi:hypothetical protein